jgi:S-DNA-T family DNA segregation ATPase FtsK/SpoIIIE
MAIRKTPIKSSVKNKSVDKNLDKNLEKSTVNMTTSTRFAKKNRDTLLPSKTALLLNDLAAVLIFAASVALVIMCITYNPNDNCWFRNNGAMAVTNKFGNFGAYFSDIILSVFGFSGWWLTVGLFYMGYRKIIRNRVDEGSAYTIVQMLCFIVLLISSSVFEYVGFYYVPTTYLHNGFGGMVGQLLYPIFAHVFGQLGTILLILLLITMTFSITFSVSLGTIAEKVGWIIELIHGSIMKLISRKPIYTYSTVDTKTHTDITTNKNDSDNDNNGDHDNNHDSDGFDELLNNLQENSSPEDNSSEVNDQDEGTRKKSVFDLPHNTDTKTRILSKIIKEHKLENNIKDKSEHKLHPPHSAKAHKLNGHSLLPSTDLLNEPKQQFESISAETIDFISTSIENKLAEFGVEAKITNAESGPVITRYELLPARGVRGDKIVNLGKEVARGLALTSVRIVETIPGKNSMGIEVPNFKRQIIYLKEIFDSPIYQNNNSKLTLALGKDIAGNVIVTDLAKMPHLLVAGTTGSGKSVAINTMILSILFQATADEVKFIMIDPKMVELSFYQDIPHLLAPVVTDMTQAANALKWTVGEMELRYRIMAKIGCKNIATFNQKITHSIESGKPIVNPLSINNNAAEDDGNEPETLAPWPYIVVIIDELADLMMVTGKKIEQFIARIAQKARAVGIHLIVATQRPSVDVITGLIKANIPTRMSFQVSSKIDSRTILDQMGAETLLGQGDMLFLPAGTGVPTRIHGAYVNDDELHNVVEFLKSTGKPNYIEDILTGSIDGIDVPGLDDETGGSGNSDNVEKDSMFDDAVKFIYDTKRCSISSLQTRFGIGYNRAARIMAHLEKIGMVRRNDRGAFELLKSE